MGELVHEMERGLITSVYKCMPAQCPPEKECVMDTRGVVLITLACMVLMKGVLNWCRGLCIQKEKEDSSSSETDVPTVVSVPVYVWEVSTQSMCTYNWRVLRPHFEYIVPLGRDGVWVNQEAVMQPEKPSRKINRRWGVFHLQNCSPEKEGKIVFLCGYALDYPQQWEKKCEVRPQYAWP